MPRRERPRQAAERDRFPATAHAAQRAAERYGLTLTWADLNELADLCRQGGGRTGRQADGTEFHCVVFANRVLHVVFQPVAGHAHGGFVRTVLPAKVAEHVVRLGRRHRARRLSLPPRDSRALQW